MAQMDFQERVMLGQLGQRDRRGRMGDRVLAQALAPRPVYSTGGALAQGLSGALAGALMNMDDRDDEAAQKRAIERAGEFEQQRQQRYQDQLSLALNGATLPAGEGQQGPTLPAPRGEGRIDALAGLAGNNPLAATMLNVEMRREDAARQERLAREARAHAAALAGRPRLPEGWRMGANGTAERIPGFEPTPTTGFTPIWTQDPQGNLVPALPTNDGRVVPVPVPAGSTFLPPTRDIRLGDRVETITTAGGQAIGAPRTIENEAPARDAARGRAIGDQQGNEISGAPRELRQAETMLGQIDAVLNHRGMSIGTGALGLVARRIPGTAAFDFGQRVEQLQGQTFLQAFESLRGGGAITQIEGEKATQAIARLNAAQSQQDFRQSLQELRDIVSAAAQRARGRIPGDATPSAPTAPSQSGGWSIRPAGE